MIKSIFEESHSLLYLRQLSHMKNYWAAYTYEDYNLVVEVECEYLWLFYILLMSMNCCDGDQEYFAEKEHYDEIEHVVKFGVSVVKWSPVPWFNARHEEQSIDVVF